MSSNKELFKILDSIGKSLDISEAQHILAEERYKAIGKWLAEGEYCILGTGKKQCFKDGDIYPQGSIKLETAVKPTGADEFDIDLVFYTPNISADNLSPELLKELIGDRLKEHKTYKNMLSETNRGWCVNYANEFHLDITPSLDNHHEPHNESELVADTKLQQYMPSNPRGYAEWFENISNIMPTMTITKSMFESRNSILAFEDSATVTEIPEHNINKPLLKRFIQIFKRHRNVTFEGKDNAPISIIITTLATKSYLYCIERFSYDNEYDLMVDVLKNMPVFITEAYGAYIVDNPTVDGENFAEKWNEKPIKKINFDNWHTSCIQFFSNFHSDMGQDVLLDSIEEGFGSKPAELIREQYIQKIDKNRAVGTVLGSSVGVMSSVKANTFYGI